MTEHTPNWTPEEIAALIDDLIEDPDERERLEAIVASDPEAKRWADDLRADREALDDVFRARLDAVEPAEFQRAVMTHLASEKDAPRRTWMSHLLRPWVPAAMAASLVLVFLTVPMIWNPDLTWTPPQGEVAEITPPESTEGLGSHPINEPFFAPAPAAPSTAAPDDAHLGDAMLRQQEPAPGTENRSWNYGQEAEEAERFSDLESNDLGLADGTRGIDRDLPSTVRGRVQNESGRPVADAVVTVETLTFDQPREEAVVVGATTTDFDGDFEFSASATEQMHRFAEGSTLYAEVQAPGLATDRREIDDRVESQTLEFALPPASSLSGQVVDGAGVPVAGATVIAVETASESPWPTRHETTTDEFGMFEIERISRGTHAIRVADSVGTPVPHGVADVSGETVMTLESRSHENFLITGRVLGDNTNEPQPGEEVQLRDPNAPRADLARLAQTTTNEAGHFAFHSLAPDVDLELDVHGETITRALIDGEEINPSTVAFSLLEDTPSRDVTLAIPEKCTIAGRAIDVATNEPVAGLTLRIGGVEAVTVTTDEQGHFVAEELSPNMDAQVIAIDPNWLLAEPDNVIFPRRITLPHDQDEITVAMKRGHPLGIEAVTERNHPVAGADVRILDLQMSSGLTTTLGRTDEQGQAQVALDPEDESSLLICVTPDGDATAFGIGRDVELNESVRVIFRDPSSVVRGQVMRESSEVYGLPALTPETDMLITTAPAISGEALSELLELRDPGLLRHARTDHEGHYQISVPSQIFILRVGSPVEPEWMEVIEASETMIERNITLPPLD